MSILKLFTVFFLTILYAWGWHNQPAQPEIVKQRTDDDHARERNGNRRGALARVNNYGKPEIRRRSPGQFAARDENEKTTWSHTRKR